MKQLIWMVLLLGTVAVQTIIVPFFAIYGYGPDILLLCVVSVALNQGKNKGMCCGFMVGLLQDLFTGHFFGVNILIKMFIGYCIGAIEARVYKDNFFLPAVSFVAARLFSDCIWVIFMLLFSHWTVSENGLQIELVWITYVYTVLLAWPIYRFYRKVLFFMEENFD